LLFDLGKVVIDIDFDRVIDRWAAHARCDRHLIKEQYRRDLSYKRHEVGEIDSEEFFVGLKAACNIAMISARGRRKPPNTCNRRST
jgi:glucose-1-phosphatase